MKKNEIEVKKPNAVSAEVMSADAWGSDVPLSGQDVIIAKILPMQLPSKLVADGKARMGEFRDSLTGALIADIDQKFDFLPFHVEKFWDIEEQQADGGFKWVRSEPIIETPGKAGYNDDLEWKDTVDGINVKRTRKLTFYGLLGTDLAAGTALPYTLAFKSMSLKEGKKLLTQMYVRNRRASLPPCGYHIVIHGSKQSNDKGKFIVPTMELGPRAKPEEVTEAFEWYKMLKAGKVKEDDAVDVADITDAAVSDSGEF